MPAGLAELPPGPVLCRHTRQLWFSCCNPPRGCSSVLGCSSSIRAPWRPVSAPSPWWVSSHAGPFPVYPAGDTSPIATTVSLSANVTQGGHIQLGSLSLPLADCVFARDPGRRWCWVPMCLVNQAECPREAQAIFTPAPLRSACLFPAPVWQPEPGPAIHTTLSSGAALSCSQEPGHLVAHGPGCPHECPAQQWGQLCSRGPTQCCQLQDSHEDLPSRHPHRQPVGLQEHH